MEIDYLLADDYEETECRLRQNTTAPQKNKNNGRFLRKVNLHFQYGSNNVSEDKYLTRIIGWLIVVVIINEHFPMFQCHFNAFVSPGLRMMQYCR